MRRQYLGNHGLWPTIGILSSLHVQEVESCLPKHYKRNQVRMFLAAVSLWSTQGREMDIHTPNGQRGKRAFSTLYRPLGRLCVLPLRKGNSTHQRQSFCVHSNNYKSYVLISWGWLFVCVCVCVFLAENGNSHYDFSSVYKVCISVY